ncbi:hypothetical protein DFS34DRAFT_623259 [Phlyctochytrium arcticum]|nr:hypothetical protein DFS34DRAFT_623259 [Phlyctochytrium arcticum]
MSSPSHVLYAHLSRTPIAELLRFRSNPLPLVAVPNSTPLSTVISVLRSNNILAVPVYSEDENAGPKDFEGIVSIWDIMRFTVFREVFELMEQGSTSLVGPEAEKLRAHIDRIMEEQSTYFATPIKSLLGLTPESTETWTLNSSAPLSSLLQFLTSARYHRCLIIDDSLVAEGATENDALVMITQTDLINYILESDSVPRNTLREILELPVTAVEELALRRAQQKNPRSQSTNANNKSRVVTVSDKSSALSAFREMHKHNVSAVAITDEQNALVANLSASDLRNMSASNLDTLLDNVFTFLEVDCHRRADQVKADQLKFVEVGQKVHVAVQAMRDAHIHRIWIADDNDHPVGVVTLSDVLSVMVPDEMVAIEE